MKKVRRLMNDKRKKKKGLRQETTNKQKITLDWTTAMFTKTAEMESSTKALSGIDTAIYNGSLSDSSLSKGTGSWVITTNGKSEQPIVLTSQSNLTHLISQKHSA